MVMSTRLLERCIIIGDHSASAAKTRWTIGFAFCKEHTQLSYVTDKYGNKQEHVVSSLKWTGFLAEFWAVCRSMQSSGFIPLSGENKVHPNNDETKNSLLKTLY